MLFSAVFNLILGLLIVLSHNVWEWSWTVIITILGYMSILKGIIHFYCPEKLERLARKMASGNGYTITGTIGIALGIYLTYIGFSSYMCCQ